MNWFSTTGNGSITAAGPRRTHDAMNGNAVMYDAGRILTVGGAPAYENANDDRAYLIDITRGAVSPRPPTWPYAGPSPTAWSCRMAR